MQGKKISNSVKTKLMDALVLLGVQKNYLDISITELCQTAGINRCTFYRYFDSKDALLKELESFMLYGLQQCFSPFAGSPVVNPESYLYSFHSTMASACKFLQQNREAFIFLLSANGSPYFRVRLKKVMKEYCVLILQVNQADTPSPQPYVAEFLTSGTIDVIELWLRENVLSVDQISQMLLELRCFLPR